MADHDPTTVDPDVLLAHVIAIQGHVSQAIPATPATDRHLRHAYGLLTQLADAIRDLRAAGRLLPEGGRVWEAACDCYSCHPELRQVPDLMANLRASLERAKEARAASWEPVPDTTPNDVAKCPNCGRQSRSYSRGCSQCGFGRPVPDTDGGEKT